MNDIILSVLENCWLGFDRLTDHLEAAGVDARGNLTWGPTDDNVIFGAGVNEDFIAAMTELMAQPRRVWCRSTPLISYSHLVYIPAPLFGTEPDGETGWAPMLFGTVQPPDDSPIYTYRQLGVLTEVFCDGKRIGFCR